jgi:polyphosphate kinase
MQTPAKQAAASDLSQPQASGDRAPAAPAGVAADAAAAVARQRAAETPRLDPNVLVNRELSLLAFQWRVFEEVRDPANPLLERVRFLSIAVRQEPRRILHDPRRGHRSGRCA